MARIIIIFLLFLASFVSSCNDKQHALNARGINHLQLTNPQPVNQLIISNDPKKADVDIEFNSTEAGKGLLLVYTADAALVSRKLVYVKSGSNNWRCEFPEPANGVYWVRLSINDLERSAKVLKE